MHKRIQRAVLLFAFISFFNIACQKEIKQFPSQEELASEKNSEKEHGHLKQTKTFSDEVAMKWIQMQLRIIQSAPPLPTLNGIFMGYAGLTLYESVVPGMPGYQSIASQLNGSPVVPVTHHGMSYHWAASANAAMASIIRNLYANASPALKVSIDSLEGALNTKYQGETNEGAFQRSVDFGKAVAQAIFNWSKTDGTYAVYPPYVPPVGPGLWAPTPPAFIPAVQPYLGLHRTFVEGSLAGTAPPAPPTYSTVPSSEYYSAVKEVYDVSLTLTPTERAQALYYRDNPGYQGGGGGYLSILFQLLEIENPSLDWAAISYAKVGITGADAWVGCWQTKYLYNVERPIRYIREVLGHPTWNPVFGTPPHPDFPSGHSVGAGAAEVVFTSLLGNHYPFTNHAYDYLGMPAQVYSSFSDMAAQIGRARVLAGIHYTYSCVTGREMGNKIAQNILNKLHFKKDDDDDDHDRHNDHDKD